ncbi:Septin-7 [Liparis tanakae]|uniref:Septin-7 n=1 Tax=Liparis tanakae TaxID=230148 RepID=A0A4Z2HHY2_9TELE|nr:Septin-7 [Liparis tanakae]
MIERPETAVPGIARNLEGYVGFANLPNQVYRKSVKRGFEFTLMVVGNSAVIRGDYPEHIIWIDGGRRITRPEQTGTQMSSGHKNPARVPETKHSATSYVSIETFKERLKHSF